MLKGATGTPSASLILPDEGEDGAPTGEPTLLAGGVTGGIARHYCSDNDPLTR